MTNNIRAQIQFHDENLRQKALGALGTARRVSEFTYTFENFFHPYVADLISQLNQNSLQQMMDPDWLASL